MPTETHVYLVRLNRYGLALKTIGLMSLAEAELAIERGTSRLVAVDCESGAVVAASDAKDMYRVVLMPDTQETRE